MSSVNLCFVGDIAFFPKTFDKQNLLRKSEEISNHISGDIKIGNFEFPFSEKKIPFFENSYLGYLAPDESVDIINSFKFDVFSLANNHIMDWGEEGLFTTIEKLERLGAKVCGAGKNIEEARKPVVLDVKGVSFGFLAYCQKGPCSAGHDSPGAAPLDRDMVLKDVINLKKSVDHVIPLFHWGTEFSDYPYPPDMDLAHDVIEAGASLIIGHHPHVIQGVELYLGRPIFYSLGSFIYNPYQERIFVDNRLDERLTSMAVEIIFSNDDSMKWNVMPFRNHELSMVPRALSAQEENDFREKFQLISGRIDESGKWYYKEAFGNLAKREIWTIIILIKDTKGLFLLKIIRKIKIKHFRLILSYFYSFLKKRLK